MVRAFASARVGGHPGAVLGLALVLGACGRVSLGSTLGERSDDASGGSGGAAGQGGNGPGLGGSDSGGAAGESSNGGAAAGGAGAQAGSTSGRGAAPGLGGAGQGDGGSAGSSSEAGAPGEWVDAGADAGPERPLPPSCRDTNPQCGDDGNRASCCESLPVTGGLFELQSEAIGTTVPVTVSSFRLDRFEVTIGRMREFIAHYAEWRAQGQPEQDLGEHPLIPGSGWQSRFSEQLPASAEEFETRLDECGPTPFSTYAEGLSEQVPLNCISWFEAAAFCAWDGGRLPTLREFAYAAVGGALQRVYPWGDEPIPSRDYALFGCIIDTSAPVCTLRDVTPVGVRPPGAGFFGHDDLSGSMSEWVLDVEAPLGRTCIDCADLGPDETLRRWRAGNWLDRAELMKNGPFFALPPEVRNYFLGVRCARDE
jgi:sulfatase modifying factor 1